MAAQYYILTNNLLDWTTKRRYTAAGLVRVTGIHHSQITGYLHFGGIKMANIERIAKALEITVEELIGDEKPRLQNVKCKTKKRLTDDEKKVRCRAYLLSGPLAGYLDGSESGILLSHPEPDGARRCNCGMSEGRTAGHNNAW